jgi:hypothetical protein
MSIQLAASGHQAAITRRKGTVDGFVARLTFMGKCLSGRQEGLAKFSGMDRSICGFIAF